MKTTLENRKKVATNSSRSVFKRKNKVEKGGALGSRVKREQESTDLRAHKMMKDKMKPSAMSTMVQIAKQTIEIPHMTTPHETQLKEQRQEVPYMTSLQKRQLREYRQEVKEEHETRFLEGEEHLHFDGNIYEDWMETITSPQHLQNLEQHLQQQQQYTQEGLQATKL